MSEGLARCDAAFRYLLKAAITNKPDARWGDTDPSLTTPPEYEEVSHQSTVTQITCIHTSSMATYITPIGTWEHSGLKWLNAQQADMVSPEKNIWVALASQGLNLVTVARLLLLTLFVS